MRQVRVTLCLCIRTTDAIQFFIDNMLSNSLPVGVTPEAIWLSIEHGSIVYSCLCLNLGKECICSAPLKMDGIGSLILSLDCTGSPRLEVEHYLPKAIESIPICRPEEIPLDFRDVLTIGNITLVAPKRTVFRYTRLT